MYRIKRTRFDEITTALLLIFSLSAIVSLVAIFALGQENDIGILPIINEPVISTTIGGPDGVDAGSGLFWLMATGQSNSEAIEWVPITPRGIQSAWMVLEGTRLGVVAPSWCDNGYIAAPGADENYNRLRKLEFQLIDYAKRTNVTHTVTITGENPPPEPDPPVPPVPPVPEQVLGWLIYEAEDEKWGDVEVDFRDAANPFDGDMRIIKKGSANETDRGYEALANTEYGPVLILDEDKDPSEVLHVGPAPKAPTHPDGTRAEIEALMASYLQQPTPAPPAPAQADYQPRGMDPQFTIEYYDDIEGTGDDVSNPAPTVSGRSDYVDAAEAGFVHPKDDPSDLIPVVERAGEKVFCVGDRCFEY